MYKNNKSTIRRLFFLTVYFIMNLKERKYMNSEKVGKFIAENRIKKNLTQSQLAEKLCITNKAVSRWERGVGFPDISFLEPLSRELNITILELLRGEYLKENEQVEKEDISVLINTLLKINKKNSIQKIMLLTIMICFFIFILLFMYLSFRSYGFDNSYLIQLFNHISLIPFSNLYSLIVNNEVVFFLKNFVINTIIILPICCYLLCFMINKKKYITVVVVLNVFLEIFKWLLMIGIFDIDDILIRIFVCFIIYKIYIKLKGGEVIEV